MKIVLVPGMFDPHNYYELVMEAIQAKGYEVLFVPMEWRETTIVDWCQRVERSLKWHRLDPSETGMAGFSMGAMTAFVMAAHLRLKALWLMSLSAFFAEDLAYRSQAAFDSLGRQSVQALAGVSFAEHARRITCPTLSFIGEKELAFPHMERRWQAIPSHLQQSKGIVVPGARHAIQDDAYVTGVRSAI